MFRAILCLCALFVACAIAATEPTKSPSKAPVSVVIRNAHEGWMIECVAWSPDCKTVVTAGADKKVRLWDAVTSKQAWVADWPDVQCLAFTPDGSSIVIAGGKLTGPGSLSVHCAHCGTKLHDMKAQHKAGVRTLTLSPDGKLAVTTDSLYYGASVWDVATGKVIREYPSKGPYTFSASAFAPDGKTLLIGATEYTLMVDTSAAEPKLKGVMRTPPITWQLCRMAFDPSGKRLVAAGGQHGIVLWDYDAKKFEFVSCGDRAYCHSVLLSKDGKRLVALSRYPEQAVVYDFPSMKEVRTLRPKDKRALNAVAISPDTKRLAMVDDYDVVIVPMEDP